MRLTFAVLAALGGSSFCASTYIAMLIRGRWGSPVAIAGLAALLVIGWQWIRVEFSYQGNWSALFFIGDRWPMPPELASGTYVFAGSAGYDGTFYYLAAHDPWLRRGFYRYADNPVLRWRRILIPGLAQILAFGDDTRIPAGYVSANLLSIFLGTCWLAAFLRSHGMNPVYSLLFLVVPATAVSVDRLTIDTALAALTIGAAWYDSAGSKWKTLGVLALCPLARETGLCITAGHGLFHALRGRWKTVGAITVATVPFAAWAVYVMLRTSYDATPWLSFPFLGILRRTFNPVQFPLTGPWVMLAAALDYMALAGIWIAFLVVAHMAWRKKHGTLEYSIYCFAFAVIWLGKADIWNGAYEFGRTLSPLLVMLGLAGIRERRRTYLIPLACTLPRILLQFETQIRSVLR